MLAWHESVLEKSNHRKIGENFSGLPSNLIITSSNFFLKLESMSSCIRGLTPARDELDNEDDEEGLDAGAGIIS